MRVLTVGKGSGRAAVDTAVAGVTDVTCGAFVTDSWYYTAVIHPLWEGASMIVRGSRPFAGCLPLIIMDKVSGR